MKKIIFILAMVLILCACGGEEPVEVDHAKMLYDYTDLNEVDEDEIIMPHTTVSLHGEIQRKGEEINMAVSRLSDEEGISHEGIVFENSNLLVVESTDKEKYLVLVEDHDEFNQWSEGDVITVTGTFEGINNSTYTPLIKANRIE